MIPTVIQGAAMAMFFIPLTSIILSGLPPDKMPAAAGLSNFVRIMFGGIGTSLSTTLWDSRSALHHAQLAEHTGPRQPGVRPGGAGADWRKACRNRPLGRCWNARSACRPVRWPRRYLLAVGDPVPGADRAGVADPSDRGRRCRRMRRARIERSLPGNRCYKKAGAAMGCPSAAPAF